MSVFDQISKISVSCRPRVKVPQKSLDLFEKDKYSCCSSLKASSDEYLVYSGDIYTTPKKYGLICFKELLTTFEPHNIFAVSINNVYMHC